MHKGGLVTVDEKIIHLKRSLLSPLSIDDGSEIYGLYYPSSHSRIRGNNYTIAPDFMFTNVPPRMWYSVVKFIFFLKHIPGTISEVTNYLKKHNLNILSADSTRAGHRFIFLTIVAEFVELSDSSNHAILSASHDLRIIKSRQIHLRNLIDRVLKGIRKEKRGILFKEKYGEEEYGGVDCFIINSLQYFYHIVGKHSVKSEIYEPFKVKVDRSKIEFYETDWNVKFADIIGDMIPTYGFATTSTRDLNIRIQVIPKNILKDFVSMSVKYKRYNDTIGAENAKIGILSDVSGVFANSSFNIWSLDDSLCLNAVAEEMGELKVVAQKTDKKVTISSLRKKLQVYKTNINSVDNGLTVYPPKTTRLRRFPIFVSMRTENQSKERYRELFVDCGKEYGLTENDFIFFENSIGDITGSVIRAIKKCEAMIQIHHIDSQDPDKTSVWLEAEGLLARSNGLPFSIICHSRLKDLLFINKDHDYIFYDIDVSEDDIKNALKKVIVLKKGDLNRL